MEMATAHVRHETARGVVFNDVQLYKLDHHFNAGSGIPNVRMRRKRGEQALRFYQKLQGELLDPTNKNQFERKAPERLIQIQTTNVHKRQGDVEHLGNGQGARHL